MMVVINKRLIITDAVVESGSTRMTFGDLVGVGTRSVIVAFEAPVVLLVLLDT